MTVIAGPGGTLTPPSPGAPSRAPVTAAGGCHAWIPPGLAVLFALVGLVWIGQGIGAIGGSVMTGNPFWAVVGAGLAVVAVGIVVVERRRPRA